jgi:hypothetical protein
MNTSNTIFLTDKELDDELHRIIEAGNEGFYVVTPTRILPPEMNHSRPLSSKESETCLLIKAAQEASQMALQFQQLFGETSEQPRMQKAIQNSAKSVLQKYGTLTNVLSKIDIDFVTFVSEVFNEIRRTSDYTIRDLARNLLYPAYSMNRQTRKALKLAFITHNPYQEYVSCSQSTDLVTEEKQLIRHANYILVGASAQLTKRN